MREWELDTTAKRSTRLKQLYHLNRVLSDCYEVQDDLSSSLRAAKKAKEFAETYSGKESELFVLQADLTIARLERKQGGSEKNILNWMMPGKIVSTLKANREVAREFAAELGNRDTEMLRIALETIGLETHQQTQKEKLAGILFDWDNQNEQNKGELVQHLGVKTPLKTRNDWLEMIEHNKFKSLSQQLVRSSYSVEPSNNLLKEFGEYFQENMDLSMKPKED